MGTQKKLRLVLNNKKRYAKIKTYNFYRKDFWGIIRLKRHYRFKKAVYALLKGKKKFYKIILYQIYNGIKFFVRRYNYRANLLMVKKSLKFFYYKLNDTQLGKLSYFFKSTTGDIINKFFSFIERRLDILLVRSLYFFFVKEAYDYILFNNIFVNNYRIKKPSYLVKITDIVSLYVYPKVMPFFFFNNYITLDLNKVYLKKKYRFKKFILFLKWFFFFVFNFYKNKKKKKRFFGFLKIFRLIKKKKKNKAFFFLLRKVNFFIKKIFFNLRNFFYFIVKFLIIVGFFTKKIRYFYLYRYRRILLFLNKYLKFFSINNSFLSYKSKFKYYFFLIPNFFTRLKYYNQFLRFKIKKYYGFFFGRHKNFFSKVLKKFRFFKISKKLYYRLKRKKLVLYSGYPPYLEINYKLHKIILLKEPEIQMVKYPFFLQNYLFFDYFKQKSYF